MPGKPFKNVSSATRARMLRVGQKDTAPELTVRGLLHRMGLRFRLHRNDLPGHPDLVLPRHRTVVFVHGCFWHGHDCAHGRAAPQFHVGAWAEKIDANRERADAQQAALRKAGWHVETVWECQTEQPGVVEALAARLLQR